MTSSPATLRDAPRGLEARGVVVLRAGKRLLDGVDLRVGPSEIAVIEGPSGCGKSTLLRALATLIAVDGGLVLLDGVDAAKIPPTTFRRRVAYVPQLPPMLDGTVADNVATGPRLQGIEPAPAIVDALLDRVALPEGLRDRVARDLSGGEKQRVALARALANAPEVLLLDEPTSALDPGAAARVIDLVRALAAAGTAIVAVTHVEEHARSLGGRLYACAAGKLTPKEAG